MMSKTTRMVLVGLMAVCVGAMSWGIGSATANQSGARSPRIAMVSLEKVLDGLEENKSLFADFRRETERRQAALQALGQEVEAMRVSIEAMPQGSDRDAQVRVFREKVGRIQLERRVAQELLLELEGQLLLDLIRKVEDAMPDFAQRNNFDIVMLSDAGVRLNPAGPVTREMVERFYSQKRTLHVASSLDVSDEFITMMNNRFAAGRR